MGIMLFLGVSVFQPESVDTHRGDRERERERVKESHPSCLDVKKKRILALNAVCPLI